MWFSLQYKSYSDVVGGTRGESSLYLLRFLSWGEGNKGEKTRNGGRPGPTNLNAKIQYSEGDLYLFRIQKIEILYRELEGNRRKQIWDLGGQTEIMDDFSGARDNRD